MILVAFLIGIYSLYHGYKKHHHSFTPIIIFSVGFVLLFSKQIWHHLQIWFLVPAVLLIITAHYINFRSCRIHNRAHKEDCNH